MYIYIYICVTLTLRSIVPPGTLYCIKYLLAVALYKPRLLQKMGIYQVYSVCWLFTQVQNLRVGSTHLELIIAFFW